MAQPRDVVQNPLLRLKTRAVTDGVTGRSKDASKIIPSVYALRRAHLIERLAYFRAAPERLGATHGDRVMMWAKMDSDSQATSHTPHDLFSADVQANMVAAWRDGYIVEFSISAFDLVASRVAQPGRDAQRCDIFRIEDLDLFANVLGTKGRVERSWSSAAEDETGRRTFNVRLPGFFGAKARASVSQSFIQFAAEDLVALSSSAVSAGLLGYDAGERRPTWLPASRFGEELQALADSGAILPLGFRSPDTLAALIASGNIVRWEPVASLRSTLPGAGPEPETHLPSLEGEPIIGMIDGGYHSSRYQNAVAWSLTPVLVPDHLAARNHGNKVASLLIDAHLWSNQLVLPQLHCRIGVVQAVPDTGVQAPFPDQEGLAHVERAFREHPETHVWNLSANFDRDCDDMEVSELGHGLSLLARRYDKLLIISAGNRSDTSRVAPPADCEAALIVGGRAHDGAGQPAGPCEASRTGLGPEGMLKPEASWFSAHRVLGGGVETGTSYAAPLVSRLAAHTWQNLAHPSPDLVKALLLSSCDLDRYTPEMGFGSPISPQLPWVCPDNAAIVAWTAEITALQRYYWAGVRVPRSLIHDGRFVGRAKLVAILHPVLQMDGHHYMSTRLEAGIQYKAPNNSGKLVNRALVGPLNPNDREIDARVLDHKWDPVRVYSRRWTASNGPRLMGEQPEVQVYARMFWRNQFMYDEAYIRGHTARVSFVVMLEADDPQAETYNEFRRIMAENVETALVSQDIEIDFDDIDFDNGPDDEGDL